MKKIIIFFLLIFSMGITNYAYAITKDSTIQNSIIPTHNSMLTGEKFEGVVADGAGDIRINVVLLYAKKAMFSLFYIVAVGVFIFLGIKLMAARGNAEEFKKALMGFVYAVVGIVLIPMAYVLVAFVSGVNF